MRKKNDYSKLSESATEAAEGTSSRIGESAEEKVERVEKKLIRDTGYEYGLAWRNVDVTTV